MRRRIMLLLAAVAVLSGCGVEQVSQEAAHTGDAAPAGGEDPATEPAGDPDQPVSSDPGGQPVTNPPGSATPGPSSGGSSGSSQGAAGTTGAGSQPNQGSGGSTPNSATPDCPECTPRPAPDEDRLTQPRPGQANVRARRWESADVHADDVTIDITYWSGVEPCYVLDRVEVREEAARVVITLYEGSQPGFDGACTEQAIERTTRIRLTSPLRDRVLVDGSSPV